MFCQFHSDSQGYIVPEFHTDSQGYIVPEFHTDSQGYIVPEFHTDSQGYIVPYKGHIKSKLLPLCQMIITLQFRKINYNRLPVGFVYVAYISIL